MEKEEIKELFKRLREYFPADVIEWRIVHKFTQDNKLRALTTPYVDARVIMERLDDVLGPENWQTRFQALSTGHLICSIAIYINGDWVWKEDGGGSISLEEDAKEDDDSDDSKSSGRSVADSAKGDLTNAFKRCAQGAWGIGRYLYSIKIFADAEKKGRSTVLTKIPNMPREFLPKGSKPTTTQKAETSTSQKSTSKPEPPKEEKKPAEKKQETTPTNGNEPSKETHPQAEPEKKEVVDKTLQKAYAYKIPKGLPHEGESLEQAARDIWLGKDVIGYLAGKKPHPQNKDMYAPLSDDEVRLSKAAEYVWDHVFANEQPLSKN